MPFCVCPAMEIWIKVRKAKPPRDPGFYPYFRMPGARGCSDHPQRAIPCIPCPLSARHPQLFWRQFDINRRKMTLAHPSKTPPPPSQNPQKHPLFHLKMIVKPLNMDRNLLIWIYVSYLYEYWHFICRRRIFSYFDISGYNVYSAGGDSK